MPVRQLSAKLSPVVPGSAEFITADEDGYIMYTITVLRGTNDSNLDSLKNICQEKRWTVREWQPPSLDVDGTSASLRVQLENAEKINNKNSKSLLKWCPNWFNNAYVAWFHIKSIRIFVESVLRWGVPPKFSAFVIETRSENEKKKMHEKLEAHYKHLDAIGCGELGNESSAAVTAMLAGDGEYHPYVSLNVDCF